MGHSQSEKRENQRLLLKIASGWVREKGLGNLGARQLMKAADLTHGGFYGHFASRNDLVERTLEQALVDGTAVFRDFVKRNDIEDLPSLVEAYLSRTHRRKLSAGCGFAALAGDIGRSDKTLKTIFTKELRKAIEYISSFTRQRGDKGDDTEALVVLSTMIGALILARAVDDEPMSRRLMSTARAAIIDRHRNRPS